MARTREKSEWIVQGHHRDSPWVMLVIIALIGAAVVIAYVRFMAFKDVTYELRSCQQPLAADSTWEQIEAAGCEPVDELSGAHLVLYEEKSRHEPDLVEGARFTFERFPVNSVAHAVEITGTSPHGVGLLVDPEGRQIRRELSSNADGTQWSGYTGDRGPTTYWVLFTPER